MPVRVILSGKMVCAECGTEVGQFQIAPCEKRMNTSMALERACACRKRLPQPGCAVDSVPVEMRLRIESADRIA